MIAQLNLAFAAGKKPLPPAVHIDEATVAIWLGLGLFFAFWLVRPELWRRLWFRRMDPRGAAIFRLLFATAMAWSWIDLTLQPSTLPGRPLMGTVLFTDEGIFLTEMARSKYGGDLKTLWDPEFGFQHWTDIFDALWGKFSLLHMRSDPPFVWGLVTALFGAIACIFVGFHTRKATVAAWFLSNSIYNYSPIFLAGGDTVFRTMLFLCMFLRWGEAYSVDSWRRRKKAILKRGASRVPALRKIPAWPQNLLILQLVVIYTTTGWLKSGATWHNGSALYYALNLDHFYRVPMTGFVTFLHWSGLSQMSVWMVHHWQRFFWLAVAGMWLRHYELARRGGTWPNPGRVRRTLGNVILAGLVVVVAYVAGLAAWEYGNPKKWGLPPMSTGTMRMWVTIGTLAVPAALITAYLLVRRHAPRLHTFILDWFLGRRLWIGLGVVFHGIIELLLNVGPFVQVMHASYGAWLSGDDVENGWRVLFWDPARPGEHGRPVRPRLFEGLWRPEGVSGWRLWAHRFVIPVLPFLRALMSFADRLKYRVRPEPIVVVHGTEVDSVRRAALLRCWDVGHRIEFRADPTAERIAVEVSAGSPRHADAAGRTFMRVFPGLWWLWPVSWIPGVGRLALHILRQRA